ncbi:hypothetical protein AMJ86_00855 [bacterium SM23_57]|nr:MAG: hypothetical protein AMJ86_00855 [bacterium SM23_57]
MEGQVRALKHKIKELESENSLQDEQLMLLESRLLSNRCTFKLFIADWWREFQKKKIIQAFTKKMNDET